MFLAPALFDCRLAPGSPARGSGLGGADMGTHFPVGSFMALSHPRIESVEQRSDAVVLHFWVDTDRTYSLLASDAVGPESWASIADVFPTPLPRRASITNSIPVGATRFYRLVTPAQP